MLTDLREINRLLLAINELTVPNGSGVLQSDVIKECKNIVLGGHIPNHNDTVIFCLQCHIIEKHNDRLQLSLFGKDLLTLNESRDYELNNAQKKNLIHNSFLSGYYKKSSSSLLKQFSPDMKKQTFVYSSKDNVPLSVIPIFLDYLKQCDLIQEKDDLLMINTDFSEYVSLLLNPNPTVTETEIMERLKIKNIVGKVAEKIVFQYEKHRLINKGAKPESDLIQIISGTNASAGYDINSFDGKSSDLNFNYFIEVKGSSGSKFSLYWSRNEINKAKELGSNYWIYFVPNVDIDSESNQGDIVKIQNPAYSLLENDDYEKDCMKTWIHESN